MNASRFTNLIFRVLTALTLIHTILTNTNTVFASTNHNEWQTEMAASADLITSQKAALVKDYLWTVQGDWTLDELASLIKAGQELQQYIETNTKTNGQAWIRKHLGAVVFHKQSIFNQLLHSSFALPTRDIYLQNINIATYSGPRFILHELAHLLDNDLGGRLPASIFGGGPAEKMVAAVGGHPEFCLIKFSCRRGYATNISGPETWGKYAYGNNSVADDFADTFTFAIRDRFHTPEQRLAWMDAFIYSIK